MKKLLTILLILLPLASYAQQPEDNLPDPIQLARFTTITAGGGVTAAEPPSCDYATDDEAAEDMTSDSNWGGAVGTVNWNQALSGTPPSCSGTNGATIAGAAAEAFRYLDMGTIDISATSAGINLHFEIYVSDDIDLDVNDVVPILVLADGTTQWDYLDAGCPYLHIKNTTGSYYLIVTAGSTSSSVPMATNTWLQVDIHLDETTGAGLGTLDITGQIQVTFTTADFDPQYLVIGLVDGMDTGDVINLQIGWVSVDTP